MRLVKRAGIRVRLICIRALNFYNSESFSIVFDSLLLAGALCLVILVLFL